MPRAYHVMKEKFRREGLSDQDAKGKAARIFNARRKKGQKPVTRYREAFAGAAKRNSGGKY